jgi:neutral ceramidase
MADANGLRAGAAQRAVTPQVGTPLVGYSSRAAGDLKSRYVHDDLYVKALVLRSAEGGWAVLAADLIGLDAVATERIRNSVAAHTNLAPGAILVCATHTHAGPAVCPIAGAVALEALNAVGPDGKVTSSYGRAIAALSPTAYYAGMVDEAWKDWMIAQATEALVEAWQTAREAEIAFGETQVEGLASSRRRQLSDGTWADPRRDSPEGLEVVSRTEIDPALRLLAVRDRQTKAPLAVLVNYSSHPWVFNTSGLSAELAGAASRGVAAAWQAPGAAPPVVVYTTGPQGDVTLIWNIAVDKVWKLLPGESLEESLPRRERGFDEELDRLGGRLADRAAGLLARLEDWHGNVPLSAERHEIQLPLQAGYVAPAEVLLADWQRTAPAGHHRTELQMLQAGDWTLLALPGEPFSSLGLQIRAQAPHHPLMLVAVANDYGPLNYLADRDAYARGGYELIVSPARIDAGERLVAEAVSLLNAAA